MANNDFSQGRFLESSCGPRLGTFGTTLISEFPLPHYRSKLMPLIRFDIIEGRTDAEITTLLDAAHRAVLTAFAVPERDRYQVVTEHKPSRVIAQDTGLGIARTSNLVLVSVVSRARSQASKQIFYAELCRELKEACHVEPSDVIVSFTTNSDDDWSFGNGVTQYLTGDL